MNSNLCTSNPARTSVMLWKYMTNKQMHAKKTLKNWVVIKCSIQNALAWPQNSFVKCFSMTTQHSFVTLRNMCHVLQIGVCEYRYNSNYVLHGWWHTLEYVLKVLLWPFNGYSTYHNECVHVVLFIRVDLSALVHTQYFPSITL